jgi:hypothetical protein
MTSHRLLLLLALAGGAVGADLAEEIATWGPVATGDRDIAQGQWFGQAFVTSSAAHPLDGMFVVDRDLPSDGQVVGGCTYDRHGSRGFDAWYDWGRAYVRGGTDPLAADDGRPFAALGGALCLPILLSLHGEIGYSSQRKLVASGEASLFIVRVRGEIDDHVRTIRVGTGPRILGTAGPWAWGALVDWAESHYDDGTLRLASDGGIVTGFVVWRPLNHLLLGAEGQVIDHAIDLADPQRPKRAVAQASLALGYAF